MTLVDFSKWFENEMDKAGFWDGDRWNEYNERGEAFENIASDVMSNYDTECMWDWDITSEQVFESPGMDIFVTAISFAIYLDGKNEVLSYSLLYTTYSC